MVRQAGKGILVPGIDECLLEAMLVPGARGASIVDWVSGLALGTIGDAPGDDHESAAAESAELSRVATEYAAFALLTPVPVAGGPGHAGRSGTPGAVVPGQGPAHGPAPGPRPGTGQGAGHGGAGGVSVGGAGETRADAAIRPAAKDDGPLVEDLIVTTRTCYHLMRFVGTGVEGSVFLHLWLDREVGNLALARRQMQLLAERLVLG
jgi:hypothetical protein